MHKAFMPPPMATSDGSKCYTQLEVCPKGHQMEKCEVKGEEGRYCKQCGEYSFQPNENRFGDQCRLRRVCTTRYRMAYEHYGNKTTNAVCKCAAGYHFESEDQRACVPNIVCAKGFGQGTFGVCENCIEKNMWSDTKNNFDTCNPLRNCEKESRCTIVKSNGTFDNKCGGKVKDVSDCGSIITPTANSNTGNDDTGVATAAIVGGVLGGIALLIVLFLAVIWCYYRRRRTSRQKRTRRQELENMLPEIIKRSRKDEQYCKKVLDLLQKEVETRINNQIWTLAQELFRNCWTPEQCEALIDKYQATQHTYAINGYMKDWRSVRGNQGDAVEELVTCLQGEKVRRADIVLEVVSKLKKDFPEVVDGYSGSKKRSPKPGPAKFCAAFFPCVCKDEEKEIYACKDTTKALLTGEHIVNEKDPNGPPPSYPNGGNDSDGGNMTPTEAGEVYRSATTPSAPVLDGNEIYPTVEEVKGHHFYDRSDSLPVQCSS